MTARFYETLIVIVEQRGALVELSLLREGYGSVLLVVHDDR